MVAVLLSACSPSRTVSSERPLSDAQHHSDSVQNEPATQSEATRRDAKTSPSTTTGASTATGASASAHAEQPALASSAPAALDLSADCTSLTAQFDARLASNGRCSTAEDCGCYPDLRMDGKLGVSTKEAAASLSALSNAYRKKQCPTMFVSSARPPQCSPACQSGLCK